MCAHPRARAIGRLTGERRGLKGQGGGKGASFCRLWRKHCGVAGQGAAAESPHARAHLQGPSPSSSPLLLIHSRVSPRPHRFAQPSRRPNFLDLVPVLETFAISKGLTRESNFARYEKLSARVGCAPSQACLVQ